ncbi:hypothetical protein niasHS_005900 [Heterodera schachtii]|uniref:Lon proteolytic domain-containing protein n=1 Tax=Heterodera schachtii TaxID=97005 RepID=A0ABD2JRY5_HETSC
MIEVNGLAIQTVSGIGKIVKIKIQAVRAHHNLRDLRIVGREMDDSMKNSLQRAFVFSKAACSRPNERRFFEEHKFTLTILPMVNRRAGGSFSAAASLGFLALAKRKRVDDSICVTGKVNRKGKIVCVLNIEAKVTAAVHTEYKRKNTETYCP